MKSNSNKGALELKLPINEELVIGNGDIIIKHVHPKQVKGKRYMDGMHLLIRADRKIPVNRRSLFDKIKQQKTDVSRVVAISTLDQALLALMMNPSHMMCEDGGDYRYYLTMVSSNPTYWEEYQRWRDDAISSAVRKKGENG